MKTYAYGHDFGNAEVGGVLLNGGKMLAKSVPTAFTQVNTQIMRNLGIETDNALIVQMKGEQASFGIGSIALAQSTDFWHGRGDMQRYASRYSLRALLGISGSLVKDEEYGLTVVAGLPAETYQKNPSLRKDIKKGLEGTHTFTLDGGKTWRTAHVTYGTTMMEGAGALLACGYKEISAQGAGVIDVGGRTTDLYVARGSVPVAEFCKGKPVGVESATSMMMNSFEQKYEFPLGTLEARGIMHAYVAEGKKKAYPKLSVFGNAIPYEEIDAIVREAVSQACAEIVTFVASSWRQSDSSSSVAARFNPVMMIGGGVYYFFDELKKRIPHLIRPESDPVYANAHGYAKCAQVLIERAEKAKATA